MTAPLPPDDFDDEVDAASGDGGRPSGQPSDSFDAVFRELANEAPPRAVPQRPIPQPPRPRVRPAQPPGLMPPPLPEETFDLSGSGALGLSGSGMLSDGSGTGLDTLGSGSWANNVGGSEFESGGSGGSGVLDAHDPAARDNAMPPLDAYTPDTQAASPDDFGQADRSAPPRTPPSQARLPEARLAPPNRVRIAPSADARSPRFANGPITQSDFAEEPIFEGTVVGPASTPPASYASPTQTIDARAFASDRTAQDAFPTSAVTHTSSVTGQRLFALYEASFQHVCRLNRMRRFAIGQPIAVSDARDQTDRLLREAVERANDIDLGADAAEMDEAVRATFDAIFADPRFIFDAPFVPLTATATDANARFVELADDALNENRNAEFDERLPVYFTCLCLAADAIDAPLDASGSFGPRAASLIELYDQRLNGDAANASRSGVSRICPDAYRGVFNQSIVPSIGHQLRAIAAVAVSVLVLAICVALVLNVLYDRDLRKALNEVQSKLSSSPTGADQSEPSASVSSPPPAAVIR